MPRPPSPPLMPRPPSPPPPQTAVPPPAAVASVMASRVRAMGRARSPSPGLRRRHRTDLPHRPH
eukprot:1296201-Prymnesium_polylepis.1